MDETAYGDSSKNLDRLDHRRNAGSPAYFAWTAGWTAWTMLGSCELIVLPGYRPANEAFEVHAALGKWRDDVETVATCTLSRSFID